MPQPISQLSRGATGKICHFIDLQIASKLMPMGALPGSLVQVVRIAPFNGGFYLKIDNTNIVLRAQEADKILIDLDNNTHSGDNSQHT